MKNTCDFSKCVIAKRLKLKSAEECINHTTNWWVKKGEEPTKVEDCAPQRTMLMIQELSNRLIGVEKSQEQQRNALQPLGKLIEMAENYQQKALT